MCIRDSGKGSGRSIRDFNLFEALSACEEYLTGFGGHSVAAGLNVNTADIDKFSEAINKYADKHMSGDVLVPKLDIDLSLIHI